MEAEKVESEINHDGDTNDNHRETRKAEQDSDGNESEAETEVNYRRDDGAGMLMEDNAAPRDTTCRVKKGGKYRIKKIEDTSRRMEGLSKAGKATGKYGQA